MEKKELSLLAGFLPKYPSIHGKDRLFNSAVMITLIMIDEEYHFLFEKRAKGIRQGGEVCFPGGEYDKKSDTSFQDAAIRETVEELGVNKNNIKVIGPMNTIVAAMGATIDPFIGILENTTINDIKIQQTEVEKIFTIPVSWFLKNNPEIFHIAIEVKPSITRKDGTKEILLPVKELGLPHAYSKPWGFRKYPVLVYRTDQEVVWGLTAEMVNEFINLYKKII